MRIWRDAHGNLITDEQLARHIAAFGSLSRALEAGDIQLVVATDTGMKLARETQSNGRRRAHADLSTFL